MKEALRARVEAFFEEFPFVSRYAKINRFSKRPTVQRVDLDLLDRYSCTRAWGSKNVHERYDTRFLLIGVNGEELAEVRPYDVLRRKFNFWHTGTWFRQNITGETVYEAIQKLNDPNQIQYVLEIKDFRGGYRRKGFNPDYGLELILHKIPSGKSFSDWLSQTREIAANELKGELAKVNQAR